MSQNRNGVATNRRENTQLFSEGSLEILHHRKVVFFALNIFAVQCITTGMELIENADSSAFR